MEPEDSVQRPRLNLRVLDEAYAVCQLDKDAPLPNWACGGKFCSYTRTEIELSVICPASVVPAGVAYDGAWRMIVSEGPLGFTLTGLLEALTEPLAMAEITIFVTSTFTNDYLMVKQAELEIALLALKKAGHAVQRA